MEEDNSHTVAVVRTFAGCLVEVGYFGCCTVARAGNIVVPGIGGFKMSFFRKLFRSKDKDEETWKVIDLRSEQERQMEEEV